MSNTTEKDEQTALLDRLCEALQPYQNQVREELLEACCMMAAFSTIGLFPPGLSAAARVKLMPMVLQRFAERLLTVAGIDHIAMLNVMRTTETTTQPAPDVTKH